MGLTLRLRDATTRLAGPRGRLILPVLVSGILASAALAVPTLSGDIQRVNPDIALDQADPGVGMAADGRFAISYSEQGMGSPDIFVRLFSADGTPAASVIPVNAGPESRRTSSVGMAGNGSFVVAYAYDAGPGSAIRAQRFDAAGAPVGAEIVVSSTGSRQMPRVAMAPDGRFAVAWDHAPNVEARLYGADGSPVTGELPVNQSSLAQHPDVAMNASGEFVVVWQRSTMFGELGRVAGRRFSAAGAPSPEFDALTGDVNQNYQNPTLGIADDGRLTVLVPGTATLSGTAKTGLLAQRISPSDVPVGGVFQADMGAGSSTLQPSAVMDGDGTLVVTFEDPAGGGNRLYVRQFGPDGLAQGDQLLVGGGGGFNPAGRIALDRAGRIAIGFTSVDAGGLNQVGVFTRRLTYKDGLVVTPPPVTPPPSGGGVTPPPAPPPPPKLAVLPAFAKVVTLPATKACVSRRNFRIRLHQPRDVKLVSAEVKLNGKRVLVARGKRLTAAIDLRTLPKGRFSVQIIARTTDGRTIKGTRRYRTCAVKRRGSAKGR